MWDRRVIVFLLLVCSVSLFAKPKEKQALTVEQEQQFLYYFYAARHAIEQEDFARAFVLLDFCHEINPNDAFVNDHIGVLLSSCEQKDAAGEYFAKAYETSPSECNEHYLDYLLGKEQWKKALKVQNQVDALNGYNANSALNKYRIYLGLHKGKQAVAEIDHYLEQDPGSITFLIFRADIHAHLGEDQQVFDISQRIKKLLPLSVAEYELIKNVKYCAYYISHLVTFDADSLVSLGQLEKAYMNYEIAMYLWPKNLTAVNNYAYSMATHGGDLSRAEKMSATTIQAEPNNAVFLDTYAWILHLKKQDTLAEFYLKKALENAHRDEVKEVIVEHLKGLKGEGL